MSDMDAEAVGRLLVRTERRAIDMEKGFRLHMSYAQTWRSPTDGELGAWHAKHEHLLTEKKFLLYSRAHEKWLAGLQKRDASET